MTTLNKNFVPYTLALKLKELGFDEPCFGYYNKKIEFVRFPSLLPDSEICNSYFKDLDANDIVTAPLWQQAFEWMREKYKLHPYIDGAYPWFRYYINTEDDRYEGYKHLTYEEAQLECLTKLIEIVQDGK